MGFRRAGLLRGGVPTPPNIYLDPVTFPIHRLILWSRYEQQNNSIFSICYPEGFEQGDGSLKFVRGSHLFRDPEHCRADTCVDADLEAGWLRGETHPLTGEPLKVEGLSLPPGSIVSLYAHVAHAVEPRKPGSDRTRWASLFCFRDGEHKGVVEPPPSPGREVPPVWAQRAAQGDVPQVLRSLLEGDGIFGPHWVRAPTLQTTQEAACQNNRAGRGWASAATSTAAAAGCSTRERGVQARQWKSSTIDFISNSLSLFHLIQLQKQ